VNAGHNLAYVWPNLARWRPWAASLRLHWVVIGGAKPFFEKARLPHAAEVGGRTRAAGRCLLGSLSPGAHRPVRTKELLLASALLFAGSSILTGWARVRSPSFGHLAHRGRRAIGMASNLSPMYIAEIAPAHLRGASWPSTSSPSSSGIWPRRSSLDHRRSDFRSWDAVDLEAERAAWNAAYGWRWMSPPSPCRDPVLAGALSGPKATVAAGLRRRNGAARAGPDRAAPATRTRKRRRIERTLNTRRVRRLRVGACSSRPGWGDRARRRDAGACAAVERDHSIFNYAERSIARRVTPSATSCFNIVITGTSSTWRSRWWRSPRSDRVREGSLMLVGAPRNSACRICCWEAPTAAVEGLRSSSSRSAPLGPTPCRWRQSPGLIIAEMFPNRVRGTAVSVPVVGAVIACFQYSRSRSPCCSARQASPRRLGSMRRSASAGFVFVRREGARDERPQPRAD